MNYKALWQRRLKRCGIACALLVGVFVALLIIERMRGAAALSRRLAELKQRGERLKVSELEPAKAATTDDAAAALLLLSNRLDAASSLWKVAAPSGRFTEPGKQVVASRLTAWSYEKKTNGWPEVRDLLAQDGALAEDIRAALQRGGWNDGCDYHNGFIDFKIGPLVMWKNLSQRLAVSAQAALVAGDTETAVARVEDSARLVKLQTNSPLIICQLVRFASAAIAWNAAWEVVTSGKCSEPQLERLQAAWDDMDFSADMARAMEMERVMTLDHFDLILSSPEKRALVVEQLANPIDLGLGEPPAARGFAFRHVHVPIWRFAWARQDQLRALNQWQETIEFDRLARTNSWSGAEARAQKQDDEFGWLADVLGKTDRGKMKFYDRLRYLISEATISVGSHATRKAMQMEVQRRMMIAVIAVQRHQLRHGKFPERLDALVPEFIREVPVDLMNGKVLSYRLADDGSPPIYSVGEDGMDDGGDFNLRPGVKSFKKIWDGKDAVWPAPASPEAAEKAANTN